MKLQKVHDGSLLKRQSVNILVYSLYSALFILNKWLRLLEILLPYHQNIISITHFLVMSESWLIIVGI